MAIAEHPITKGDKRYYVHEIPGTPFPTHDMKAMPSWMSILPIISRFLPTRADEAAIFCYNHANSELCEVMETKDRYICISDAIPRSMLRIISCQDHDPSRKRTSGDSTNTDMFGAGIAIVCLHNSHLDSK